jgi:hypothetical protein
MTHETRLSMGPMGHRHRRLTAMVRPPMDSRAASARRGVTTMSPNQIRFP